MLPNGHALTRRGSLTKQDIRKNQAPTTTDLHRRPGVLVPPAIIEPTPSKPSSYPSSPGSNGTQTHLLGVPLKYASLFILALQNASLSIFMHYSRVSASSSKSYSAASAVLMNEVLKGSISFVIALRNVRDVHTNAELHGTRAYTRNSSLIHEELFPKVKILKDQILSPDCWKLSIPAILYVIQNNLQYVASANLDVVVFQVSYQMKILTTAAFSVILLKKRLNTFKWMALFFLALGVGLVQIQAGASGAVSRQGNTPLSNLNVNSEHHIMHPVTGFLAVIIACFTSGLAGVYFEMVLKGSKADLWVRNVQLSLFSIVPALAPLLLGSMSFWNMFDHFGFWAWLTVFTQVGGGLITALVIKYSDNILKGFATSLSIILSFLASVVLFRFQITPAFLLGSSTVLASTWLYNQPDKDEDNIHTSSRGNRSPFSGTPFRSNSPILGQFTDTKQASLAEASSRILISALGISSSDEVAVTSQNDFTKDCLHHESPYHRIPYSNHSSRSPTPRSHSPALIGKEDKLYIR